MHAVEYQVNLEEAKNAWLANTEVFEATKLSSIRIFLMYLDKGPILYAYANIEKPPSDKKFEYLYSRVSEIMNKITQVQNIQYNSETEVMPSGYRHVVISADKPFVFNEASRLSSTFSHTSVHSLMDYLDLRMEPSQCLQLSLGDLESGRDICFLRWFADRRTFVLNTDVGETMFYGTSGRTVNRMYITSIQVVERNSAFPITDVKAHFLDNQIHPYANRNF